MRVEVQCYSGRTADEIPVQFKFDDYEFFVEEVLEAWRGPDHQFFKIQADDGNVYILQHEASVPDGAWDLVRDIDSGSASQKKRRGRSRRERTRLG